MHMNTFIHTIYDFQRTSYIFKKRKKENKPHAIIYIHCLRYFCHVSIEYLRLSPCFMVVVLHDHYRTPGPCRHSHYDGCRVCGVTQRLLCHIVGVREQRQWPLLLSHIPSWLQGLCWETPTYLIPYVNDRRRCSIMWCIINNKYRCFLQPSPIYFFLCRFCDLTIQIRHKYWNHIFESIFNLLLSRCKGNNRKTGELHPHEILLVLILCVGGEINSDLLIVVLLS